MLGRGENNLKATGNNRVTVMLNGHNPIKIKEIPMLLLIIVVCLVLSRGGYLSWLIYQVLKMDLSF